MREKRKRKEEEGTRKEGERKVERGRESDKVVKKKQRHSDRKSVYEVERKVFRCTGYLVNNQK